MQSELNLDKSKHTIISHLALSFGLICFLIVFLNPIKFVHTGSLMGDAVAILFTTIGLILSITGLLVESEKKLIPFISLLFSSSFFISWVLMVVKHL